MLEPGKLAKHLARTHGDPEVRHVVGGRRLELGVPDAIEIAAAHAREGRFQAAERIIETVGGLAGIRERSRSFNRSDLPRAVADWAEVACSLSGVDATIDEIEAQLPLEVAPSSASDDEDWNTADRRESRNSARFEALARCTDWARLHEDDAALVRLQEVVDADAETFWTARCHLVRALNERRGGEHVAILDHLHHIYDLAVTSASADSDEVEEQRLPQWLLLQCAEVLLTGGLAHSELATRFIELAGPVQWPATFGADAGLDPYMTWLSKRRLMLLHRGRFAEPAAGVAQDVGQTRLRLALDDLAALEVLSLRPSSAPTHELRASQFDRIIRVVELPRDVLRDLRGGYTLFSAAQGLWSRTIAAAADLGGPEAVSFVLRQFKAAWDDPHRSAYWTPRHRMSVIKAVIEHGDSSLRLEAQRLLATTSDSLLKGATDAHDRAELLLDIAEAWSSAGNAGSADALTKQAVAASYSVGTHDDDRQLLVWVEWAARAHNTGAIAKDLFLQVLHELAHRVLAVGDPGHLEAEVAELLIRKAWEVAPRLSADIAEMLVGGGVIGEVDGGAALVSAAAEDPDVSVQLVGAAAVTALIPVAESDLSEMIEAIAARSEEDGADGVLDRIGQAFEIWSLEPRGSIMSRSKGPHHAPEAKPPHQLLVELQALEPGDDGLPGSETFRASASQRRTLDTATKLLREADRLRLGPECIGYCAAMVADEGGGPAALAALRSALAVLSPRDWSRQWDSGARLRLMEASCHSGNEEMRAFAWSDLASCVASESLSSPIFPREILHLVATLAEPSMLGEPIADIRSSMDRYIPTAIPPLTPQTSDDDAQAVFCGWFTRNFGHPARQLDFGSRQVLARALALPQVDAQRHVAKCVRRGGWEAEAALDVLLRATESADLEVGQELLEAVEGAAHFDDAILRDLARMVLNRIGRAAPEVSKRPLPVAYRLILPPAPERHAPELDRTGVPFIDMSDPQQVVAPFDLALRVAAGIADVDEDAVLHRAAGLSKQLEDRWTEGGHRAFAARVHQRRQRLIYRPWAFMIGRRALGRVVAELHDAELLRETETPAYALGLIDRRLITLETLPLDSATPQPFRPADASDYSAPGWETDTTLAADAAAVAVGRSAHFILAERSRWRLQLDDCPREQRFVRTFHGIGHSDVILSPRLGGWEDTDMPAEWYPDERGVDFGRGELVVSGREMSTDSPHMTWLALHPSVGRMMNWEPGRHAMEWFGPDGVRRAWTEVRARGQIELKSRSGGSTAEVWRVLLGPAGKAELEDTIGPLVRRLTLKRDRPVEDTPDGWTDGTQVSVDVPPV